MRIRARRRSALATLALLLACAGFAAPMSAGCSQDRALAVNAMNKGLQANSRGETSEAVRHLKEAAAADPNYAEPPYILGQIYEMKFQEEDNALAQYKLAVERDKERTDPKYFYKLGTIQAKKGQHDEAIGSFAEATKVDETFAPAWFRMGQSRLATRDYPGAVDAYTRSIKADARMTLGEDSTGGEAYHALGDLYNRFGFFDKALQVYKNGVENNPEAKRLYQGMGVAQLKLGRAEEAAASFQKAIELDNNYAPALFNLALARVEMGQPDEALKSLEEYISRADASEESRVIAANGLIAEIQAKKEEAKGK